MASTKDLAKQFLLELDQEITAERLRIADLKERTISNKGQKAWNRIRASETKHLYNLKERRHVLTLVHAFPNKNWGYQAKIVGVVDGNGTLKHIFRRGNIRISDFIEIAEDIAQLGDIKSETAITKSVAGGVKRGGLIAVFRKKSTIEKQLSKERKAAKKARKLRGKLLIEYFDPLTKIKLQVIIEPDNLKISRIVSYQFIHNPLPLSSVRRSTPNKLAGKRVAAKGKKRGPNNIVKHAKISSPHPSPKQISAGTKTPKSLRLLRGLRSIGKFTLAGLVEEFILGGLIQSAPSINDKQIKSILKKQTTQEEISKGIEATLNNKANEKLLVDFAGFQFYYQVNIEIFRYKAGWETMPDEISVFVKIHDPSKHHERKFQPKYSKSSGDNSTLVSITLYYEIFEWNTVIWESQKYKNPENNEEEVYINLGARFAIENKLKKKYGLRERLGPGTTNSKALSWHKMDFIFGYLNYCKVYSLNHFFRNAYTDFGGELLRSDYPKNVFPKSILGQVFKETLLTFATEFNRKRHIIQAPESNKYPWISLEKLPKILKSNIDKRLIWMYRNHGIYMYYYLLVTNKKPMKKRKYLIIHLLDSSGIEIHPWDLDIKNHFDNLAQKKEKHLQSMGYNLPLNCHCNTSHHRSTSRMKSLLNKPTIFTNRDVNNRLIIEDLKDQKFVREFGGVD